ncbi:Neutral ceramidase [Bienertia sinuspersici]
MGDAQGLEKSNIRVESNSHVNKAINVKEFDSSSNNIKEVHENSNEEDVNSQLNSSAHEKTSLNGELEMDQNEDVEKVNSRSGSPITIRLVKSVDKQKKEVMQFNTSNVGNLEPLVKGQSEENDAMQCSFDHENDTKKN